MLILINLIYLSCTKGNFPMISDDLVNSYHLLLCALDLVYGNALQCPNHKELLNPNFKGMLEKKRSLYLKSAWTSKAVEMDMEICSRGNYFLRLTMQFYFYQHDIGTQNWTLSRSQWTMEVPLKDFQRRSFVNDMLMAVKLCNDPVVVGQVTL